MLSARSYLAANPFWLDENPDPPCPQYRLEPESFQHALLLYPACSWARNLLLKEVTSVDTDSPVRKNPPLIQALLGQYITSTRTGFPLEMSLNLSSPSRATTPSLPSEDVVCSRYQILLLFELSS